MRFANMKMCKPISPMSWVSGIHDRLTSSSLNFAASVAPRALAMMFACVSTTPFGSLVEPDENWMKAMSSGCARCSSPAREMSSRSSTRNARALQAVERLRFTGLRGERTDALERCACRCR